MVGKETSHSGQGPSRSALYSRAHLLGDPSSLTFGEDTLTKTMMGAREVLASCAGWLMVSASNTTNCRDLASSNMRSISLCTSAKEGQWLTRGSGHRLLPGL